MDFRGFVYLLQERSEMFCKTTSAVLIGMSSEMITVETDVSGGLPYFDMVGYLSSEGSQGASEDSCPECRF